MTSATKWARRVRQWRASGKSSDEFAAGKGFSGGGLRYWAHRLKLGQKAGGGAGPAPAAPVEPRAKVKPVAARRKAVRIARVIRSSPGAPPVSTRADFSARPTSVDHF